MKNSRTFLFSIFIIILLFASIYFTQKYSFLPQSAPQTALIIPTPLPENPDIPDIAEYAVRSVVAIEGQIPNQNRTRFATASSGFIISSKGFIATNKHVVSDKSLEYQVTIKDQNYPIKEVYTDPSNDIAIIQIEATDLQALSLGDSTALRVGERVLAVGTSFGELQNSVTFGIVSGLNRNIEAESPYRRDIAQIKNAIQTDAAINPGNSGGPLLNLKGEVVGINTAGTFGGENIGFAIPINALKSFISRQQISL